MRNAILALALAAVLPAGLLLAQESAGKAPNPDETAITAAIALGQDGKANQLLARCTAGPGGGGLTLRTGPTPNGVYGVAVGTNIGHIAAAAQEAKQKYQPYARSNVPVELLEPAVYVWLSPQEPTLRNDRIMWTSPLKHVVLMSRSDNIAAQPERLETKPIEWTNIAGTFEGTSAIAVFNLDAVKALMGDLDVIAITAAGERRCRVTQSTRKRIGLL